VGLRQRLNKNADYIKEALRKVGLQIPETPGPIIPIVPKDAAQTAALKKRLLAAGIYPPFLKYPNGHANGYFRFVISSEHSREQLDKLIKVLKSS
jgi:7-keto-8-aminopelargonate synthetase-like enzyme